MLREAMSKNMKIFLIIFFVVIVIVIIGVFAKIFVWGVVREFITQSGGGAIAGCASIDLTITNIDRTANTITVQRNQNLAGEVELSKIKFVFEGGDGIIIEKNAIISPLKIKTFNFVSGEIPANFNKVSAYPIIVTEEGSVLCDKPAIWSES